MLVNVIAQVAKYRWAMERNYFLQMHNILTDRASKGSSDLSPEEKAMLDNKQVNEGYMAFVGPSGQIFAAKESNIVGNDGSGNGVQVIKIIGSMFKRADFFSDMSGAKSMQQIEDEIKMANMNPNVGSIVFEIDSPGGTVEGTETLSNAIKNSNKPTIAYVSDSAFSAAYWAASQTDEIIASGNTAFVGSIGVLMTHVNRKNWYEMNGLDITYVTADGSEQKIFAEDNKPLTQKDVDELRAIMNHDRNYFVKAVKSGRGNKLSGEEIFTGKIFSAKDALKNGLIDRTGTLEDAIRRAARLGKQQTNKPKNQKLTINDSAMKFKSIKFGVKEPSIETIEEGADNLVLVEKADLEQLDEELTQANEKAESVDEAKIEARIEEATGKVASELNEGIEKAAELNKTLKAEKETLEGQVKEANEAKEKIEGELETTKATVEDLNSKVAKLVKITGEAGAKIVEADQDLSAEQEKEVSTANMPEEFKSAKTVQNARKTLAAMGVITVDEK